MARHNFPDLTFEVVQHDRSWAIWLVVILGGVVGVFAFTALIVSSFTAKAGYFPDAGHFPDNSEVGRKPAADRAISGTLHLHRRHQRFTRRFTRHC